MDTFLVVLALTFIAVGVYGAFILPRGEKRVRTAGGNRGGGTALFHAAFASTRKPNETRVKEPRRLPQLPTINSFPVVGELPRPAMNKPGGSIVREMRRPADDGFSEVDMLRAQVEELRSEIAALSSPSGSAGPRYERPHMRRSGVGIYTHLPRILRRQVREVRSVRRTLLHS